MLLPGSVCIGRIVVLLNVMVALLHSQPANLSSSSPGLREYQLVDGARVQVNAFGSYRILRKGVTACTPQSPCPTQGLLLRYTPDGKLERFAYDFFTFTSDSKGDSHPDLVARGCKGPPPGSVLKQGSPLLCKFGVRDQALTVEVTLESDRDGLRRRIRVGSERVGKKVSAQSIQGPSTGDQWALQIPPRCKPEVCPPVCDGIGCTESALISLTTVSSNELANPAPQGAQPVDLSRERVQF